MTPTETLRKDKARIAYENAYREALLSCPPARKGHRHPPSEESRECSVPKNVRKLVLGNMGTDWIASRDLAKRIGAANSRTVSARLASLRSAGWVESKTQGDKLVWKRTGKPI